MKSIKRAILAAILLCSSMFTLHAQQTPIPDWVKDIGGTGESKVTGIAVDKFDNVYVAGNFQNTLTVDLSGVSTPINLISKGDYDIFVAKYTPDGRVIWAKSIGGTGLDQINNLAVDLNGNAIIGASFSSPVIDCDPGAATANVTSSGAEDALIVKLDQNGNYVWARSIGGAQTDRGHVVTTDLLGNVIFVGSFSSTTTVGSFALVNKSLLDGFIAKYDAAGNILWAYAMGSTNDDEIKSLKTNSNNEIVVMGYYTGNIDLNPKGPAFTLATPGITTYFLAKYDASGLLVWANKIDGAPGQQTVASIAVGPTDDIFVTGVYGTQITFNSPSNTISLTTTGAKNLFITKYTNDGAAVWAQNITGNAANPYSYYITADVDNNAYIGGFFDNNLTFMGNSTSKTITAIGTRNTFFAKYDGSGAYVWAFGFGSNCVGNYGHKIAVDSKKNVLLGGAFCGTVDFNPSICNLTLTAKHGNSDGYLSKFNQIKLIGEANIASFQLETQVAPALINNATKKITITVAAGTDLTNLKPTISTDIGVLEPLSGVERDFTNPVNYVISSNCINYTWTVEVSVTNNVTALTACSGEQTTFIGSALNTTNNSFQWQAKDVNGNWVNAPGEANDKDYIFPGVVNNVNADVIFEFRRKVTANGADSFDSDSKLTITAVTVNNMISTSNSSFCDGKAVVTLSGSMPTGAQHLSSTFSWERRNETSAWSTISGASLQSLSPEEFTETTYFRRVTLSNGCKSYSNELKIEVFPLATSANAGLAVELCNETNAVLNANQVAANEIGTWSVVSPSGYLPFDATTMHNPKATITGIPANTAIVLKWTIKQQVGCMTENSDEVRLFNYETPLFSMPSHMTINEGQSLPIPASLTGATGVTYTYQWTPAIGLNDPTLLSPVVTPVETSIYQLQISYGTCSIIQEIKIILNKAKQIEGCSGEPFTLAGAVDNDNASLYQWQILISGTWTDIANAIQADYTVPNTINFSDQNRITEYRRLVKNAPYYDSRYLVTLFPTTTNNAITAAQTIFCANEVEGINITGSTPTGAQLTAQSFLWQQSSDGTNWTANGFTTKDLAISNLTSTTYFRRVTFSDGCSSYSNPILINIYPPATIAYAGENQNLCGATSLTLAANIPGNNETGEWQVIAPLSYQPFTAQNIHDPTARISNLPQNESVILKWTISNSNCGTSTDMEVTINAYAKVVIQAPTTLNVNYGKPSDLGVTANLTPQQLYKFQWSPSAGLSDPNILSPMATPEDNTTYIITISYGATCIISKEINVRVLKEISFPNTFSPNGDGVNETWQITGLSNYPGSRLSIFNRYGSIIYEGSHNSEPWDGRHKGKRLPTGTYYYVLTLKDKNSTKYKGSITILN